jgi:thioredoxin reductase (NADPH)
MAAAVRKVIIIGAGPAGYTAAIYAARANLAPLLITGLYAGGQLTLTTSVENYPGFVDGVMGPELMDTMRKQAERFGTEMIGDDVTAVDFTQSPFTVRGGADVYQGQTLIIATGASAKLLGLPAETALMGRGVSTCATCDGFFFKDQNIMVVGGGDTALEEALYLARLGRHVDVVHRRDTLRASKIMQERAAKNPKIGFIWDSVIDEVFDPTLGKVTAVRLKSLKTGATSERPVDGLFIAIGHQPNTALFRGQVELTRTDYIKVVPGTTQTSVPGVFAAGDVQDHVWRQAITAAGTGCMAALEAERYLEAIETGWSHGGLRAPPKPPNASGRT